MSVTTLSLRQLTLRSALTGFWLIAGLFLTLILLGVLGDITGQDMEVEDPLSFLAILLGFGSMGALWARILARRGPRRLSWAWALAVGVAYTVAVYLAIFALNYVEQNLGWFVLEGWTIHHLFMLAFGVAAFFVAGLTCAALGLGLGGWPLAGKLGLIGGAAAALAFLLVAVILDAFGYRVGAPGAEARLTMLGAMLFGLLAAALTGSALVGRTLAILTARTHTDVPVGAVVPEV